MSSFVYRSLNNTLLDHISRTWPMPHDARQFEIVQAQVARPVEAQINVQIVVQLAI